MGTNDIFDLIITKYNEMTKAEAKVADYILAHRPAIDRMTISELSTACDVSEATLTRFCRFLGFHSFGHFRTAVVQTMTAAHLLSSSGDELDAYGEVQAQDSIDVKAQKLCNIGIEALKQTLSLIDVDTVSHVVDLLWIAKNVYCFGQGNSSVIAMATWGRFVTVTNKFHWISESHIQADTAALLEADDIILYFSFSGVTREMLEVAEIVKSTPGKLILFTRYANAPGAALADHVLLCGANEGPYQQGSAAVKIGHLFIIELLFNEYCSRDLESTIANSAKTLKATFPKIT